MRSNASERATCMCSAICLEGTLICDICGLRVSMARLWNWILLSLNVVKYSLLLCRVPSVTHTHPGHGSTFLMEFHTDFNLKPARKSTHSFTCRKRKLTSWYCAHNRNTGARSVGVKPCCSAPVLPAEGWLSAVANEGLMPCNYSNEARLAALQSRGKCGHSCNRRCQAGKEIVLFKRSGKKCFIGQGGGGRVLNTHRWRHCVKNALYLVYCVHKRKKMAESDTRCESQKNANRNTAWKSLWP